MSAPDMASNPGDGWRENARCRDIEPEIFYPAGEHGVGAQRSIAAAKAVCATCPVVDECLDAALTTADPWGIWGGKTAAERRLMSRSTPRVLPPRKLPKPIVQPGRKTHCINNHEFTPETTGVHKGYRYCRVCARDRQKAARNPQAVVSC